MTRPAICPACGLRTYSAEERQCKGCSWRDDAAGRRELLAAEGERMARPAESPERSIYWTDTADAEHARCLACERMEFRRRDGRTYLYLYDGIGPVCSPRCAHKLTERPAESPVHPLPPPLPAMLFDGGDGWQVIVNGNTVQRGLPFRVAAERAAAINGLATTPPPVRVVRRPWLLSAMLEDIYRGAWKLEDPELDAAIQQVAALANGQPVARLALEAS